MDRWIVYEVQWDYESSLAGPWLAGQVIKMLEREADAINRDSPGVLVDTGVRTKKTRFGSTRQIIQAESRDWDAMTVDELRDALKERGLKVRGVKGDLIERLKAYEGKDES